VKMEYSAKRYRMRWSIKEGGATVLDFHEYLIET